MKINEERKVLTTKLGNDKKNDLLSIVIKEFIKEKLSKRDGVGYFIDGNDYRKLVTETDEKLKHI